MMRYLFGIGVVVLGAILTLSSCVDAPSFDDIPEIKNARLDLGSNPVNPYDTSVVFKVDIRFDFSDGDGDLGRLPNDSTTSNVFLVNLDGPLDEVNFDFWIEDRAGQKSNTLSIPSIPLNCD